LSASVPAPRAHTAGKTNCSLECLHQSMKLRCRASTPSKHEYSVFSLAIRQATRCASQSFFWHSVFWDRNQRSESRIEQEGYGCSIVPDDIHTSSVQWFHQGGNGGIEVYHDELLGDVCRNCRRCLQLGRDGAQSSWQRKPGRWALKLPREAAVSIFFSIRAIGNGPSHQKVRDRNLRKQKLDFKLGAYVFVIASRGTHIRRFGFAKKKKTEI
jgi:hypothetical protein